MTEAVWSPALLTALGGLIVAWTGLRKTKTQSVVSMEQLHNDTTRMLMEQNKQLLQSIGELRAELEASFARITELNHEVVRLRGHIETLEAALDHRKEATP